MKRVILVLMELVLVITAAGFADVTAFADSYDDYYDDYASYSDYSYASSASGYSTAYGTTSRSTVSRSTKNATAKPKRKGSVKVGPYIVMILMSLLMLCGGGIIVIYKFSPRSQQ